MVIWQNGWVGVQYLNFRLEIFEEYGFELGPCTFSLALLHQNLKQENLESKWKEIIQCLKSYIKICVPLIDVSQQRQIFESGKELAMRNCGRLQLIELRGPSKQRRKSTYARKLLRKCIEKGGKWDPSYIIKHLFAENQYKAKWSCPVRLA